MSKKEQCTYFDLKILYCKSNEQTKKTQPLDKEVAKG